MNIERASAFDELHCLLQRRCIARSQEQVQMVRHYHELVQKVNTVITAFEDPAYNSVCYLSNLE